MDHSEQPMGERPFDGSTKRETNVSFLRVSSRRCPHPFATAKLLHDDRRPSTAPLWRRWWRDLLLEQLNKGQQLIDIQVGYGPVRHPTLRPVDQIIALARLGRR